MTFTTIKKAIQNKKVLIDSNIIIYLTDSIQPYAPAAQQLFSMVESGDAQAVISILSISEVMHGPLRKGYEHIALEVRDYLINFPNSRSQEITCDVLEIIGKDERIDWKRLRTVDSLIIASGLLNDVDFIISNDRHFKDAIPSNMLLSIS